jgi:hypothetical protein
MEIISRLYVGDDASYERLKDEKGWSFLRCCKDGPGGHRQTLGYTTLAAPHGPDYLWCQKNKRHMALNMIDVEDPQMMPEEMILKGIEFINERMNAGDKVLVACNAGISRSPTTAMLFLRTIGELDQPFNRAQKIFDTLYPKHDPGAAIEFHARNMWDELKGINLPKG